ncbi:MAG: hypothetical protein LQ351_006706 [Letrouitia transgressa]|nr:MAG: hypothetical protein LQ351_006706 [Letrouitia transgressa]
MRTVSSNKSQLINLDFTEIGPDPATNYTWFNGQSPTTFTAFTRPRLSRKTAPNTPSSSTLSLPQPTAQASPAKNTKSVGAVGRTSRQALEYGIADCTHTLIEGGTMHQSEETEAGQWSETSAGEQINQSHVNSGFCLAVNELKILYLTIQPSDERDNIVRFQLSLTVTESGFPKDCQAIISPKKFHPEVVVVNFETAGMNADFKDVL